MRVSHTDWNVSRTRDGSIDERRSHDTPVARRPLSRCVLDQVVVQVLAKYRAAMPSLSGQGSPRDEPQPGPERLPKGSKERGGWLSCAVNNCRRTAFLSGEFVCLYD